MFNLAVLNGKLPHGPIFKLKQEKFEHRERIPTKEEREKIRGRIAGSFRDFVFALEQTGGRPFEEVGRIEASMVDWKEGTIKFKEHKTAKYGKKRHCSNDTGSCRPGLV